MKTPLPTLYLAELIINFNSVSNLKTSTMWLVHYSSLSFWQDLCKGVVLKFLQSRRQARSHTNMLSWQWIWLNALLMLL